MDIGVRGREEKIRVEEGSEKTLLQVLVEKGVNIGSSCGGKGKCGECKVRILSKAQHIPLSEQEKRLLSQDELEKNTRLACFVRLEEDMEIEVSQEERNHPILSKGYLPEIELQPAVSKKVISIQPPSLSKPLSYEAVLKEALDLERVPLEIIKKLSTEVDMYTAVYFEDELIDLEAGNTFEHQFGLAVDIGTTTVVATLVDFLSGEQLETEVRINEQTKYGSDVLSRISYVIENEGRGLSRLQRAISNSLNTMVKTLCKRAGISSKSIYQISVAANTTMNHLLLNVDPASLGRSPYVPMFKEAKNIPVKEAGIREAAPSAVLSTLPSVSSFVGADVTAGIFASGIHEAANKSLLIDIGTNGEIVLSNHGKMVSCSCAAGPALEGMNISSGMKASEGAVEDVVIEKDTIHLTVIGDADPAGLCGSGVLAAMREFIQHGLINKRGRIIDPAKLSDEDYRKKYIVLEDGKRSIRLSGTIRVSQNDVRQIQLTKAAILSGITALLQDTGFEAEEIDEVFVAGQFGSHIPEKSFIETGIFPPEFLGKIRYIGNSSHSGAYLSLVSEPVQTEMEILAGKINYIELSVMDNYEKLFAKSSQFTYRSEEE